MSDFVYNVLQPRKPVENPPILFLIHGYGSDENDLFSFADQLNDRFLIVSLRAPLRLAWGGYAWYNIDFTESASRFGNPEEALISLNKLNTFIDEIVAKYSADPKQVCLLGFSQGAILSYALAMRNPLKFKSVLALSGYIFKEIMPYKIEPQQIENLEFFASHGIQDEVIPIAWARNANVWLKSVGAKTQYHEYMMGHGINPECFRDMLNWIKKRYPAL